MFRKSLNLIFKRKRNKMKTDSTEEENNDDTDTVRIFKKTFINRFELFKLEAAILAEGCFNVISLEMLKNKNFHFNELLDQASLQAVLTRANIKIPMKLTKMRPHEVNALMASSMFKAYKNDRHFDDRMMLEENEKNKLTLV